jgi:hypothetical protein
MLGKLIGRLSYWGWRDGRRADRRQVRNREARQWRNEGYDWQVCPPCAYGTGERCTCAWR